MNTSTDVENKESTLKNNGNKPLENMDITKSYLHFRNYISDGPIEEYNVKKKCVELGKELLPTDLEDGIEQQDIDVIYMEACKVLKEQKPDRRTIEFDFVDFGKDQVLPVYKIKANDADDCHAEKEELKDVLGNFLDMQYQSHIDDLQGVDDQIFHELVKRGIIKKENPSIRELRNERKKQRFKLRKVTA